MTDRPILLDLFCGAGGASAGYAEAGFEVVGVDLSPQPHYPYEFIESDWQDPLWVLPGLWEREGRPYAIHASPPCQLYSTMTKRHGAERVATHPDLVDPVREHLLEIGAPFVLENVEGAPLVGAVMLCGTMFGLGAEVRGQWQHLRRHRLWEPHGFTLWPPGPCAHVGRSIGVYGNAGGTSKRDGIAFASQAERRQAMGIPWMTGPELSEAIPPAYTKHVGAAMLRALTRQEVT